MDEISAGDVQQELKRYNAVGLEPVGRGLVEAGLQGRSSQLAAYSGGDVSPEYLQGRARRSNSRQQARENALDDENELEIVRRVMEDYENNRDKSRRRTPVDPTLLMMGIGKRK